MYIDETGGVGRGARRQPFLTVVAAIVDETKVQALHAGLSGVAWEHLGWMPNDFEFHGRRFGTGTVTGLPRATPSALPPMKRR